MMTHKEFKDMMDNNHQALMSAILESNKQVAEALQSLAKASEMTAKIMAAPKNSAR